MLWVGLLTIFSTVNVGKCTGGFCLPKHALFLRRTKISLLIKDFATTGGHCSQRCPQKLGITGINRLALRDF